MAVALVGRKMQILQINHCLWIKKVASASDPRCLIENNEICIGYSHGPLKNLDLGVKIVFLVWLAGDTTNGGLCC